jgi:hypothetical protein
MDKEMAFGNISHAVQVPTFLASEAMGDMKECNKVLELHMKTNDNKRLFIANLQEATNKTVIYKMKRMIYWPAFVI